MGTDIPGTVADESINVDNSGKMSVGEMDFERPEYRRVVQLLIRKNSEGDTPLNLAIKNRNHRCFELMLSILLNAKDVFVSRQFLSDLRFMMELETNTVEAFFNSKFVENVATAAIVKVKWSIEEESVGIVTSSQLFTKMDIQAMTCPEEDEEKSEEKVVG